MRSKTYKMRSLTPSGDTNTFIDLPLQFEGCRAYAIWDSIAVGPLRLQVRLEIDPALLQKVAYRGCDYFYRGELILPQPRNN
jgi:hypothetical protein